MAQRKKWLRPQFLFPSAILLAFAVIMTVAMIRPKTFTAIKLDSPGAVSANWSDVSEQDFFEQLSVAVRVEVTSGPEHYDIREPWEEYSLPSDVYTFQVNTILANSRIEMPIESEKTYHVHSFPSALTALDVAGQENSFILFLYDRRDMSNFKLEGGVDKSYYDKYFDTFGYGILTPIHSIFRAEPNGTVKTELLPVYLQGEGEYTTMQELQQILAAGREKYGTAEAAG